MKYIELENKTNEIRKVGRIYDDPDRAFSYINIYFDNEKWADASKFLPGDFDLCYCKVKGESRILPGWHTGFSWDGSKIKPSHEILYWKLNYDT